MKLNRRTLLEGLAATALTGAAIASPWDTLVTSRMSTGSYSLVSAASAQANIDDLMVAGPLGEQAIGDPNAPITVVEYASMTCSHCAHFHKTIFPELRKKYVDTGKVRFILREFPLDPLAAGAFMLARCSGPDRYFDFVDVLFHQQEDWTRTNDPVTALFTISKQAGFTQESFDSCLSNQQMLDGVNWVKERAAEKFDVRSTPTFFVNGEIHPGVQTLEEFDKLFEPLL